MSYLQVRIAETVFSHGVVKPYRNHRRLKKARSLYNEWDNSIFVPDSEKVYTLREVLGA